MVSQVPIGELGGELLTVTLVILLAALCIASGAHYRLCGVAFLAAFAW